LSSKYIFIKIYRGVDLRMLTVRLKIDKTLEKLKISRYELAKRTGIRYQIIDNYYKNKVVRYDNYVLSRMCEALSCDISDILELTEI